MQLPIPLLNSLYDAAGFNKEAFEQVHASGEQITSIRINLQKKFEVRNSNCEISPVPWTQYGYYLKERPSFTFDPLFHAGCYYVQEASGMFLEQVLQQTVDLSRPLKVLDLCAAPGGKSTHLQSLISTDSLLVSNEVIKSRAHILKDNMVKWGCNNVIVTNNDPKDFAKLEGYFDVIVVDAPCSGSGLFRRDPETISEWSKNNVQLCSQRQQRILADVWPALKESGMLVYSTCSYSREEDEDILKWIMDNYEIENRKLKIEDNWGITEVKDGLYGYRFWPDKVKGEGFFIACFQKKQSTKESVIKTEKKPEQFTKAEIEIISGWTNTADTRFIKYQNTVYAWPDQLANDFTWLLEKLRVVYSGTIIGELIRDKLVPHHALAMSDRLSDSPGKIELGYEMAVQYLQKKDVRLDTKEKGWQIVTYLGHSLGWINVLHNRVNNYYPKELRILKDN